MTPIMTTSHGILTRDGDMTSIEWDRDDGAGTIMLAFQHVELVRSLLDTALKVAFRDVLGASWSAERTDAGLNITFTNLNDAGVIVTVPACEFHDEA